MEMMVVETEEREETEEATVERKEYRRWKIRCDDGGGKGRKQRKLPRKWKIRCDDGDGGKGRSRGRHRSKERI